LLPLPLLLNNASAINGAFRNDSSWFLVPSHVALREVVCAAIGLLL
jgi:hypothetical protein